MRQRDKIILSVVGGVIVVGGFWMLALSPKLKESKKLGADIAKKEKAIEQTKQDAEPVQHAKVNFSTTYATLAKLGKAVPVAGSVDDDVPSLLLQLNQGGKVTKTGFLSFTVDTASSDAPAAAAAPAAPATPSKQGSAGGGGENTATKTAGAAGSGSADAAAPAVTLNKVSYNYTYVGTLYDLENLMHYLTGMVAVDGERMKISGRLLAIQSVHFTILASSRTNPLMQTDIAIVSYAVPKGSSVTDAAPAATGAGDPQAASSGSGSNSPDQVPGAPPQAQPATPPSASVRRP